MIPTDEELEAIERRLTSAHVGSIEHAMYHVYNHDAPMLCQAVRELNRENYELRKVNRFLRNIEDTLIAEKNQKD